MYFSEKAYDSLAGTAKGEEVLRRINERKMKKEPEKTIDDAGRTVTRYDGFEVVEVPRRDKEMQNSEYKMLNEGTGADRPWGPLPGREPPVAFPLADLPGTVTAMTVMLSDSVQVSFEMAACMVLGAVSTAAAGRVKVRVDASHEEPCQLFIAIGADPSERKSACMSLAFEGLYRWEREEKERRAPAVRHCQETKALLEEGITRARKAGDRQRMADLIDELNGMEEVKPVRLILTDTTPEALSRAMAQNGGRMAVVSSEGQFFNILAGSYSGSGAANLDVVLKGYSGEPVRVERIGREGDEIDRACLSLCLAVQPAMLGEFLNDPTLAGRGMASRFLVCMPESRVGGRATSGMAIKADVMEVFASALEWVLGQEELTLTLSAEAYARYDLWFQEVERQLGPGGELADLGQGWGGKLCGNTARIAALMQLTRRDEARRMVVDGEVMGWAIGLARWFRDQALRLMGGEKGLSPEANEALAYMVRKGETVFPVTEIRAKLRWRRGLKTAELVESALDELAEHGYIRLLPAPPWSGTGRPPKPRYELHPELRRRTAVNGSGGAPRGE